MADGYRFPVDLTSIMLFASALGETNRIYWDEEHARDTPLGSVIAPPTFAAAAAHWNPRYALRGVRQIPAAPEDPKPKAEKARGGSGGGGGQLTRVLHGEQRYEYHRPLTPGMVLTVTGRAGKSWEKEGRRGGKLRFSESVQEFRDENGDLVMTATSVGVVTEKAVES